jgi:hypothetical protein
MQRSTKAFATLIVVGSAAVAETQSSCLDACRDEVHTTVTADLSESDGGACQITLANGEHQVTYLCGAQSTSCVNDLTGVYPPEETCTPVGDVPHVTHVVRSRCGFSLQTFNDDEGRALQNALGGSQYSITATCNGQVVYSADGGAFGYQICEG